MRTYIATIEFEVEAAEILDDREGRFEIGYLSGEVSNMVDRIKNIKVSHWQLKSWKPK